MIGLLGVGCAEPDRETEIGRAPMEEPDRVGVTPGTPAPSGVLSVASLQDGTEYLTDEGGRALYLLDQEPPGLSLCYGGCAEAWPPMLASEGQPARALGPVDQDRTGTVRRDDGPIQVTYAGHALHYFREDVAPGDIRGQDRRDAWGRWYLVRPDGQPVEEHIDEAPPPNR